MRVGARGKALALWAAFTSCSVGEASIGVVGAGLLSRFLQFCWMTGTHWRPSHSRSR